MLFFSAINTAVHDLNKSKTIRRKLNKLASKFVPKGFPRGQCCWVGSSSCMVIFFFRISILTSPAASPFGSLEILHGKVFPSPPFSQRTKRCVAALLLWLYDSINACLKQAWGNYRVMSTRPNCSSKWDARGSAWNGLARKPPMDCLSQFLLLSQPSMAGRSGLL